MRQLISKYDILSQEGRTTDEYCPRCGASRRQEGRFCYSCGYDLVGDPMASTRGQGPSSGGQYGAYYQPPPYYQYSNYYQYQYYPNASRFDPREKDPGLALIFSLIFPGMGQLYLGDTNKGIALIAGFILVVALMIVAFAVVSDPYTNLLLLIGFGIVLFIVYIWQLFDAFNSAKKHNSELSPMGGR